MLKKAVLLVIICSLWLFAPTRNTSVAAQTYQGACFGIAAQGAAARIKGTNQLIAGATIRATRNAGEVTCSWGGKTVSSTASCTTDNTGQCGLDPVNCGGSSGSAFTLTGSATCYICEPASKTIVNNTDNSIGIVDCVYDAIACPQPPEQPRPTPLATPATYSISGSLRSCTLEAAGWTDAALTDSTTISVDNTTHSNTGSSYTFSGLATGGYTLRAQEISGYTGPFESCSSQTATTTMGFTLGPSLVKNLYFKQISTTPPPPDVCPAPTCTNTSGQAVSVGGTQTCSTCGGTQTCQASGCTASWSTCSIPQTSCTQTGTFNCYVGTATNITSSSGDVTVTTSGDGSGWDRINWHLNNSFVDTTAGTPGTNNTRMFSSLANNTTYTAKAQFYKSGDTSQNMWCTGTPQFTTGTPTTTASSPLKCYTCATGDRWYWDNSCAVFGPQDQNCSTTCRERTDPNTYPQTEKQYCWLSAPEPYLPLTGQISGGIYIRQTNGQTVLGDPNNFGGHTYFWITSPENTTGQPLCPMNSGGLCITANNALNQYYSGASSSLGRVSSSDGMERDGLMVHSWPVKYRPLGYTNYQTVAEINGRDEQQNCTYRCLDSRCGSGTAFPCYRCGTADCRGSTTQGVTGDCEATCQTVHVNDGYECKIYPGEYRAWSPALQNGVHNWSSMALFCMPAGGSNPGGGPIGFNTPARIDLLFEEIPNPTCVGGSWLTTRTGSSTYSNISLAFNPYDKTVTQAFYAIRRDTSGYTDWIPALYSSNRAHTGPVDFGTFGTPADWSIKFKVIWSGGESTTEGTCPFPSQAYSWLEAKGADIHANSDVTNNKVASGKFFLFDPASAGSAHNGQASAQSLNVPSDRVRFAANVSTTTYSGIQFPQLDYEFLAANAKPWDGSSEISHPGIVTYQGDITLTTPPTLTRTGPGITVVLVNGNLTINGSSGSFRHTLSSPKDGIVYLVRGNVQFASTLNSANGVYIADRDAQGRGGTITSVYGASTDKLVLDGMLYAQGDILLNRQLATSQASESVRYQSNYSLFPSFLEGITRPTVTWQEIAPPTEPIVVATGGATPSGPATPVVQWNMNEGSGTVVYDTARGNDGYLKNGTAWLVDGSVKALQFDGVDDHVLVPHSDNVNFKMSDTVTFSTWVYPTNLDKTQSLFHKQLPDGLSCQYCLTLNTVGRGKLTFQYAGKSASSGQGEAHMWTSDYALPTSSVWYHIVLVYKVGDAQSVSLYVNGNRKSGVWTSGSGSIEPVPSAASLSLGSVTSASTPSTTGLAYAGYIDDLRIYRSVLTSDQVASLYTSTIPKPALLASLSSGLRVWYQLEQRVTQLCSPGGDHSSPDSSGNGNTGCVNKHYSATDCSYGPARVGNGLACTIARLHTSASVRGRSQYSVSAWVMPSALPSTEFSFMKFIYWESVNDRAGVGRSWLSIAKNFTVNYTSLFPGIKFVAGFRSGKQDSPATHVWSTTEPSLSTWYHVVAVFDSVSDVHRLYVNGQEEGSVSMLAGPVEDTSPNEAPRWFGGFDSYWNDSLAGSFDDLRIYTRVLTPQEVSNMYLSAR